MGVTQVRLVLTSAALVIGAALMPAAAAVAAPAGSVVPVERPVATLTLSGSTIDTTVQHVTDDGVASEGDETPEPPVWLLVLLVPILVGGAIGAAVTLRRLR